MFDLTLTGGLVIDGSGVPGRRADVGIRGGCIAAIGDLAQAEARETVALSPLDGELPVVCPGFVDVHSHSDTYILLAPSARSKLTQGVTTEICGNCGASCAPIGAASHLPSDWAARAYPARWRSVADYRAVLATCRPAVNIGLLTGHNTLRRQIVGMADRPASPDELQRMCGLLESALDDGSLGLSSGLEYPPGMFAPPAELTALAAVAARHDRIYTSHMRNEGDRVAESVAEALAVGAAAGVRVQISHLKVMHRRNWHKLEALLRQIETARSRGLEVAADRYPYTACATDLDVILPAWFQAGGRAAALARLADRSACTRLREHLRETYDGPMWETITIGGTVAPETLPFRGQPLMAVAAALGVSPEDAVLELCRLDELRTGAFFEGMQDANMRRILESPYVMVGSDASLRTLSGPLHDDFPHPRAFGTFPRYLRLVREGLHPALSGAIHRLTGLPARHFGLAGRGVLRTGYAADMVVLDPRRITDRADFRDPWQLAEGIDSVVVNGVLSVSGGVLTGRRGGQFLAP